VGEKEDGLTGDAEKKCKRKGLKGKGGAPGEQSQSAGPYTVTKGFLEVPSRPGKKSKKKEKRDEKSPTSTGGVRTRAGGF